MKKLIPVFIAIFIFFSGCSKDESSPLESEITGNIAGKVTFINTVNPIASATIKTIPEISTILSDQLGNFSFNNVAPGVYTVTASKSGYISNSTIITVSSNNTATANIQLTPEPVIPTAPILSLPLNNSFNEPVSPLLKWNEVLSAVGYTVQISKSSAFDSFVFNQSDIPSSMQQISGLENSTTYYWRVSATNSLGTSLYSDVWSFITIPLGGNPYCPGIPIVTYKGKIYNTVKIGEQCWLKENLDVGNMIPRSQIPSNNNIIEKYCYGNDTLNCAVYGGLYMWSEAMLYSSASGAKGICPDGFHIPTYGELQTLGANASNNSNTLKAIGEGIEDGAGTNTSGFSALLSGYNFVDRYSYGIGFESHFWSSTGSNYTYSTNSAYSLYIYGNGSNINFMYSSSQNGYSVRCLKN